jgi:Transglycosylase-like domain
MSRVSLLLALLFLTLALSATAATVVSVAPGSFWYRDAICETGHNPPNWRFQSGQYEGGIAFAHSTWVWWASALGYARRYPHAYQAPAAVQAAVAEYGLDHYGDWGCVRILGR